MCGRHCQRTQIINSISVVGFGVFFNFDSRINVERNREKCGIKTEVKEKRVNNDGRMEFVVMKMI